MENLNVVNDTQPAVVEQAGQTKENGGAECGTQTEPAVRMQSARDNSGFRKMRLENEALRARLKELEGLSDIKRQSDIYLNRLVEDQMSRDLDAIQRIDPTVKTLHGLGEDFIRLVQNGVEAVTAYHAVKQATDGNVYRNPTIGRMSNAGASAPEYYSSRELDRLTKKDLENPAVFRKAMKSLKKL